MVNLQFNWLTVVCVQPSGFSALCVSQARKARDGDGAQTNGGPLVLKDAENMQDSTES